jgi:hypothetical protein
MARINIQVDLKEHEILEKQIKKEFEGIARGMARETMREELEKEINRLIDVRLAEVRKGEYYSSIVNNVTRIIAAKVSADIQINTAEVDELITAKVENYLDNKMRPYNGIEEFIETYINKSIAEVLKK